MRFSPVLLLAAALALPALGCARNGPTPLEVPDAPPVLASLDEFEAAFNHYVLLPPDHRERIGYRRALSAFLVEHLDHALDEGDPEEAETSLQIALALYTPGELRTAKPHPALVAAAHRLYRETARRGAELPSLLALAAEQHFGDEATRRRAVNDWEALERWLVDNGPFGDEPLLADEELERVLETVAADFPSPFIVRNLADLYVARYDTALRAHTAGGGLGNTSLRRVEITGYLLMRLYLRADDPEAAIEAMARVNQGESTDKLSAIVEDAFASRRSARPLLSLAEQFVPEQEADPSMPHVAQSWGIIDNLMRRALARYPKDPFVHLMRAQALRVAGLPGAALHHLRRSVELKDDVFETWQALAELEFQELASLAGRDPEAALTRLPEIEALHQRAMKLWRDRPIRPALPEAYFTVAEGLYRAGQIEEAESLLAKSQAIEARPQTLDLLGTIALKRARFDDAQGHYEALTRLTHDDADARLRWEARARGQLGEIALRSGDHEGSIAHFRVALRKTNELLTRPAITAAQQADRYLDRGRLLFFLGEVDLATDDFEYAAELEPGHIKAYAEPMLQLVSHGYYREARVIFRRAIGRDELSDSLKLYFALWIDDLALRQGRPPDSDARSVLQDHPAAGWAGKLARHARGDLSYAELLSAANDKGERAEAFFYEGLKRWRSGDEREGKKLLQQVVDSDLMGFFEYDMAQNYLHWDELPAHARAPNRGGVARRNR